MSRLQKIIIALIGLFVVTIGLVAYQKYQSPSAELVIEESSADLAIESTPETIHTGDIDESVEEPIEISEDFHEVYFSDAFGNARQLSEFLGNQPIVLNIWASWCPPCQREMPHFEQALAKYGDQIELLMVNAVGTNGETREKALQFLTEEGLKLPVYYDEDLSVQLAYNARSLPLTVFIRPDGSIHYLHYGYMEEEQLEHHIERLIS